jgi:hypothetical protein
MEHAIPALVIAALIVVCGVALAGVTNSSIDNVGQSWRDMEALSEERLGTDDERYVFWLPHTDSNPPGDNQWTVDSISGDYRNPDIFDGGEEMTIKIHLDPATKVGPNRWLVLSTEAGITYSIYF